MDQQVKSSESFDEGSLCCEWDEFLFNRHDFDAEKEVFVSNREDFCILKTEQNGLSSEIAYNRTFAKLTNVVPFSDGTPNVEQYYEQKSCIQYSVEEPDSATYYLLYNQTAQNDYKMPQKKEQFKFLKQELLTECANDRSPPDSNNELNVPPQSITFADENSYSLTKINHGETVYLIASVNDALAIPDSSILLENKHICGLCGKTFIKQCDFEDHRSYQMCKRLLSCNLCGKKISTKGNMKKHIMIHKQEAVLHKCSLCRRKFALNSQLQTHLFTHTKRHRCGFCEKGFNKKSDCTRHQLTHSEERRYRCDICEKGFNRKDAFNIHCRTHINKKFYECEKCGKYFLDERNLINHRNVHSYVSNLE